MSPIYAYSLESGTRSGIGTLLISKIKSLSLWRRVNQIEERRYNSLDVRLPHNDSASLLENARSNMSKVHVGIIDRNLPTWILHHKGGKVNTIFDFTCFMIVNLHCRLYDEEFMLASSCRWCQHEPCSYYFLHFPTSLLSHCVAV